MTIASNQAGHKFMIAAATLAFVPLLAFSQDKGSANTAAPGAMTAQSANTAGAGMHAKSRNDMAQRKQGSGAKPTTTFLLISVNSPEQNQWMKKGCWARFYDGKDFSEDSLTLMGPVDMADMTGPFGIDWKGKISSVETGPKARVLVYDNENFKDLVSTFKPGQKSADVSKKMGFFDEFSSVKVTCDNVKPGSATKS